MAGPGAGGLQGDGGDGRVAGNIDFAILFWLLLGSIPGVLIGGHLTLSIPEQSLRLLLAGVLGLAGIKLLIGVDPKEDYQDKVAQVEM